MQLLAVLMMMNVSPGPCSAETELARAAAAYRSMASFSDTARIDVNVPGAPTHEESVEYGVLAGRVLMRMSQRYVIELRDERFLIAEEGREDAHVSAPATADLQASLDVAFEGAGSPVIPPAVLLRRAATFEEQKQAFRLKVLGRLDVASCAEGIVILAGESGSVRFHVGDDGLIREIHAKIATAKGQPDIAAEVTFQPHPGKRPPPFAAHGRAVRTVRELTAITTPSEMAETALKDLDGRRVPLRDPNGKTTVLEFWATWCAPCRITLPKVQEFAQTRRDVRVLLVNVNEDSERIRSYLQAAHVDVPVVIDSNGSVHRTLGGGLPLTVAVSGNGHILGTHAGFDKNFEEWLRAIR